MDAPALATFADYFADLPDPRTAPALRHGLLDVVTIAVCALRLLRSREHCWDTV
jgi:hypothetical protein